MEQNASGPSKSKLWWQGANEARREQRDQEKRRGRSVNHERTGSAGARE